MIIDPYKTTIGKYINVYNINKALLEFLISTNDNNLNYEYSNVGDYKLVFITGKNSGEQELPIWNHPLLTTDVRGIKTIFIDIRKYVKIKDPDFMYLSEVVTDIASFNLQLIRALYMMYTLIDDVNYMSFIKDSLVMAFTKWISTSFKASINLGIEASIKLEIVTMYYMLHMLAKEGETLDIEQSYFYISKQNKMLRNNVKYVKQVLGELNKEPKSVDDFIELIEQGVNSPLTDNMSAGVLYSVIGNSWNGDNSNEIIGMSIENPPTLIALMFVSMDDKRYKHSRLANILNNNKRAIKNDDFIKNVERIINASKM